MSDLSFDRLRTRKKPIAGRLCVLLTVCLTLLSHAAHALERLDRPRVIALARESSPEVQLAEAAVAHARALRVGAGLVMQQNPTVSVWTGPRFLPSGDVLPDLTVGLSWPIDLSGARTERTRLAETEIALAEAAAQEARDRAVFQALDVWVTAVSLRDRAVLEHHRVEIEARARHIAEVRLRSGVSGESDLALADVMLATAAARESSVRGELAASTAELRPLVGLSPQTEVEIAGELTVGDMADISVLEGLLAHRSDVLRAEQSVVRAQRDVALQERLGIPVPHFGLGGGRENEYFVRLGMDIQLPIFQRNQASVAIARGDVMLASTHVDLARARALAELHAAWERMIAARTSWKLLTDSSTAIETTERLAVRAFELGQSSLRETVFVLREADTARVLLFEAARALGYARVALERAVGTVL